jgi:hypothetical protein
LGKRFQNAVSLRRLDRILYRTMCGTLACRRQASSETPTKSEIEDWAEMER